MKLFDSASKSEEKQKESEAEQLRIQQEAARQESLEKKLSELILVGKAIYTILKQEHEERKAAYENLENVIQTAANEIIQTQEKAAKAMIAYGRENNQKAIGAINEEIVKVQRETAAAQEQLFAAAEKLNNSILDNTSVLSGKLSVLEESIKDINISVEATPVVPVPVPETTEMFVPEVPEVEVPELSLDYEEEVALEEDLEADIMSVFEQEEGIEEFVLPDLEFDDQIEEAISEDIFAVEEEPAPAPVMDDPNRAMTPDEIAALIASMN